MVPLFGIPFLERTLGRLKEAGVDDVVLAAGYLPRAIEDHLGDGSRIGMRISYVVESSPLGTAGALKNLADHITQSVFVLNGDVLTSLDLRAMIAFHRKHGGVATLHAIRVDDPSAFGCIVRDADGHIASFIEKPPREEAPTNEINAGTYLLERSVLDHIPAGRKVSIERETFPELIASGARLVSFVTDDYWLDVGRPEQYLQAHGDVLDRKLDLAASGDRSLAHRGRMWHVGAIGAPANVRLPAFIGEGVAIDPSAIVGPYAVIGDRSRIGAGAKIRDAILWDGVDVGAGARISDAILASDVRVGSGARVTAGAVVGHGANIAANTHLQPDARIVASAETMAAPTP